MARVENLARLLQGYVKIPFALRRLLGAGLAFSLFLCKGQTIITTIAGSRFTFPADGLPAINAPLGTISAVAADRQGNIYVADINNDKIFRIDTRGALTTFAGNGVHGYSGDGGPAASAALLNPNCLAFDSGRNLYICDAGNFRIRKITPDGIITTVAGNGSPGFSGDGGPATSAFLGSDTRLAIDNSNNLYISDPDNHRIRRITTDGTIRTFAGNGFNVSMGDGGPPLQASLKSPQGLAFDSAGNLYITDPAAQDVRKIVPNGLISTIAGTGFAGETGDGGPATRARLSSPSGIAIDSGSSIYIADSGSSRIRRIDPSGTINTIAGNTQVGFAGDGGEAAFASLYSPGDLAFTPAGALLIADTNNFRARSIVEGRISNVAGNGNYRYSGDGGVATSASLPAPSALVVDSAGNVNICDRFANRVRTVNPYGIINLTAGSNAPGFAGDGARAVDASLTDCDAIALDSSGNLYVADTGNRRIRKINTSGIISTIAGDGANSFSGDGGPAVTASLSAPQGLIVDSQGNVYIADTGNDRIRKVSPSGIITTIAGDGNEGYSGDGGLATAAEFDTPTGLALDSAGNLYICDSGNNVVRRISTSGIIQTVAGNTKHAFSGDGGPATGASLANPRGLTIDSSGALLIADSDNLRIRRIDSKGIISTIAGNGTTTLSGDGRPPLNTGFGFPASVATDSAGIIYIADRANSRVRRIEPTPPSLVISQTGLTFSAAVDAAAVSNRAIRILNGGAGTVSWSAIAHTTSGSTNWLKLSPAQGTSTNTTAGLVTVSTDPSGLAPGSYYGQIQISSPDVANSPRFVTVVLNILSPDQTAGPAVNPAGLIFAGSAGGANPPAQTLTVSKLHGAAISFTSSISFDQSAQWVSVRPASGSVSPSQPLTISVTPNTSSLAPGAYTAQLKLNFSDGSARNVPLALTLGPAGTSGSTSRQRPAATCSPTRLIPVVTDFGAGFGVPAGWPVAIETQVVDDCGNNMSVGTVVAAFSTSDPPLALSPLGAGTWSATWNPRRSATNVTITVTAQMTTPPISGTTQIGGQVAANTGPPILNAGGVINAASFSGQTPVAPGALIAIFGTNLATTTAAASSLPLPTTLGGAQVLIAGIPMPLLYAGPGQINAVAPFDLSVGTAQVIVQNGTALSVPEPASVSPEGPGVFTLNGLGTGSAIVVAVNPDGSSYLVTPSSPAHPGSAVVIYCTGLGGVQSSTEAGDAAPLSPLAPANDTASVTFGGVAAQVPFAGLVPTFTGLYQVNTVIPQGVTGDSVPLVISAGSTGSSTVTLPVR